MTTNENDLATTGEERADAPEDAPTPIADTIEAASEEATEVVEAAALEDRAVEVVDDAVVADEASAEVIETPAVTEDIAVHVADEAVAEASVDSVVEDAAVAEAEAAPVPRGERPAITAPKEFASRRLCACDRTDGVRVQGRRHRRRDGRSNRPG